MITEVTKYYIEGEGNPNGILTLVDGYPNMPTIYYDRSTDPVTTYNFFTTLSTGEKWRKPTITSNGYREFRANVIRVNNPDIYELDIIINTFGNSLPFEFNVDDIGIYTLYGEDSFDLPLTVQTSLICDDSVSVDELYSVYHKFTTTSSIQFYTTSTYDANTAAFKHIPYSAPGQSGFSICIIMKDFV